MLPWVTYSSLLVVIIEDIIKVVASETKKNKGRKYNTNFRITVRVLLRKATNLIPEAKAASTRANPHPAVMSACQTNHGSNRV